jgi:EthD domain
VGAGPDPARRDSLRGVSLLIFAAASPLDLSRDEKLQDELRGAGVNELQVNIRDEAVAGALALQHLEQPIQTVVSTSGGAEADILRILSGHIGATMGWEVEQRKPLPPPPVPDGVRADALANLAFIRKPREMSYDSWLQHWHGPHTQVAMESQATFGYVQNRVARPLTPDTPPVDAIVEELFPIAAVTDVHAFYGSGGDDAELSRRITQLMESVAVMGADRDIDLVPTSRYVWRLGGAER